MTEFYFVRHGMTDTNQQHKINGSGTDLSLNEYGKKQILTLKNKLDMTRFDQIYSSPLKRAYESAELLIDDRPTKKIQIASQLNEVNFGDWDGIDAIYAKEKFPEAFNSRGSMRENYTNYTSGEKYSDIEKQIGTFLINLTKEYPFEKIMLVCHGITIRSAIKFSVNYQPFDGIINPENGSVKKIQIDSTSLEKFLIYFNRIPDNDFI